MTDNYCFHHYESFYLTEYYSVCPQISYRKGQLKALLQMYTDNEKAIALALAQDMRKCNFEAVLFEVGLVNV